MPSEKPYRVLAIDPGGTTGLAFSPGPGEYHTATASTPEELYDFISTDFTDIVIENFRAHRIDHYGLYTVRLVGGVHALCHKLGVRYVNVPPVQRRAFQDEAHKLLSGVRHVIHETDALAHLLAWEYKNGYRNRGRDRS